MAEQQLGMIGLGVMGRNLALNLADHGAAVTGYDRDPAKGQALLAEAGDRRVRSAVSLDELAASLQGARAIILMVPAGAPVDAVIEDLRPLLREGDLIVDAGNSHFADTERRARSLEADGILFLGVGVSGGARGARRGPSIMPGGPPAGWQRVAPILERAAASVNGEPCVTYLGPGGAGHYVKMVHNGIEYGLMQLIAETYHLLGQGLGLGNDELHAVFLDWSQSELASYLIEISARIFLVKDERGGRRLLDVIRPEAHQKGTGRWTSEEAMKLGVPLPTIDAAVSMRALSARPAEHRGALRELLGGPAPIITAERRSFVAALGAALHASMLLTYAQGFALLAEASRVHGYGFDLEAVARIWRGGCIIRAALLEEIRAAYQARPDLPTLLLDRHLAGVLASEQPALREVARIAIAAGLPVPGLASCIGYLDAQRSARLPANLIQAQRDYFGAHGYQRLDAPGTFHARWEED